MVLDWDSQVETQTLRDIRLHERVQRLPQEASAGQAHGMERCLLIRNRVRVGVLG